MPAEWIFQVSIIDRSIKKLGEVVDSEAEDAIQIQNPCPHHQADTRAEPNSRINGSEKFTPLNLSRLVPSVGSSLRLNRKRRLFTVRHRTRALDPPTLNLRIQRCMIDLKLVHHHLQDRPTLLRHKNKLAASGTPQ